MRFSYTLIFLFNFIFFVSFDIFAHEHQKITIIGSSTIHPLVKEASKLCSKKNKNDQVRKIVIVKGGGSNFGVDYALKNGGLGMVSRNLNEGEQSAGAREFTIALDGIALMLHLKNPIADLKITDVKKIIRGEIRNWKALGGTDIEIKVFGPNSDHGTYNSFINFLDIAKEKVRNYIGFQSHRKIIHLLKQDKNLGSLGVASFGNALKYGDGKVHTPSINGVKANLVNIRNKTYPLIRPLSLVHKGNLTGLKKEFVEYLLSAQFQKEIAEFDFIPFIETDLKN